MRILLRTNWKIKSLEGKSFAAIKFAEEIDDSLVGGNGAHILIELPGVLHAPFPASFVALRIGEINAVARPKVLLNTVNAAAEVAIRKVEHGITFPMQVVGDSLFFRA